MFTDARVLAALRVVVSTFVVIGATTLAFTTQSERSHHIAQSFCAGMTSIARENVDEASRATCAVELILQLNSASKCPFSIPSTERPWTRTVAHDMALTRTQSNGDVTVEHWGVGQRCTEVVTNDAGWFDAILRRNE